MCGFQIGIIEMQKTIYRISKKRFLDIVFLIALLVKALSGDQYLLNWGVSPYP